MLRRVVLTAVASAFVVGAAVTAPVTADAAMTCDEAAKMKYPDNIVDRLKSKRECKKAWKDANGKGVLNKLKS